MGLQTLYLVVSLDVSSVVCDSIGNAEIDQLQLPADEHEVGWLQIRVHNFFLVYDMYCLQHLYSNFGHGKQVKRQA